MRVGAVCTLATAIHTVRVDFSDPRTEHSDWQAWEQWDREGDAEGLPSELWLDNGFAADAASVASRPLVPTALREVFELAAPGDLQFHPMRADGQSYWLMRVATVLDAGDFTPNEFPTGHHGSEWRFHPVWRQETLDRPAAFRIPQRPRDMWVTDTVAAAYLASGYTGLTVVGPEGEIRPEPTRLDTSGTSHQTPSVVAVCGWGSFPRPFVGDDPRNRGIDWGAVEEYLLTGHRSAALPAEAWLTQWPGTPDAVGLPGMPGLLVSTRLRDVLDATAPGDLDHHPITVDDREFWLTRVVTVIDGLNPKAGGVALDRRGQIKPGGMEHPTWKREAFTRPAIFRIPHSRTMTYTTDTIAATILQSGCTGVHVNGPVGVVR